jgi:hypothetical protein
MRDGETFAAADLWRPLAAQWFTVWKCAAIWSQASLEGATRLWGFSPPSRGDSLAALGLALDRQMRTPAFLDLVPCGLRAISTRSGFDFVTSLLRLFLDVSRSRSF